MKKQSPIVWMICLSLLTGCAPKHVPVSGVVLVPVSDTDQPSVYAEKGGTLTFESEESTSADATLEVQFLQDNVPVQVCGEGETLMGKSPLMCHIVVANGDYNIAVQETSHGKPHPPRPAVKAYIRPCKGCSI